MESGQNLLESREKNGAVLLQNVALTASGTQASGWFIWGTRKERRCFAAERGPNPFSDPKIWAPRCRGLGSSSPASPFRDLEIEAGFCHVKFFS